MRCYSGQHRFYVGVDLHARTMYIHVLDHTGKTVFDKNLPADPQAFLEAIAPFRPNLVVGCECKFAWYWLAALCEQEGIPFALGHALAMRHIHQSKSKSDRIDAANLAALLRGGHKRPERVAVRPHLFLRPRCTQRPAARHKSRKLSSRWGEVARSGRVSGRPR
ncbi:MAG TPA: transposase [Gemmataceae bacterium]|nr:transposase [Gemmataceae bacterium]